jgi:DNA-binding MarR family transcriptional regulator
MPTSAPTDLADELRLVVGRLARRIRQQQTGGLTASQHSALAAIESLGPVRLSDLAAAERVSPPTMTKIVAALESAGLTARAGDDADRRVSRLNITERGRATLRDIRRERSAFIRRRLDALSADELARLLAAMPVLTALVEEEGRQR